MGTIVSCSQRELPSIETCDGYLIENIGQCWNCRLVSSPLNCEKSFFPKFGKVNESKVKDESEIFVPKKIGHYQSPNLWKDHVKSRVTTSGQQSICTNRSHQQLYNESLQCPLCCNGKRSTETIKLSNNQLPIWRQKVMSSVSPQPLTKKEDSESESIPELEPSTSKHVIMAEINETVRMCFDNEDDQRKLTSSEFTTSVELLPIESTMIDDNNNNDSKEVPILIVEERKSSETINKNKENGENLSNPINVITPEMIQGKCQHDDNNDENETLRNRKSEDDDKMEGKFFDPPENGQSTDPYIRLSLEDKTFQQQHQQEDADDLMKPILQPERQSTSPLSSSSSSSSSSIDNHVSSKGNNETGSNESTYGTNNESENCDNHNLNNESTKSNGNDFVLNSLDNISLSSLSTVESDTDLTESESNGHLVSRRLSNSMSAYQTQLMISQLSKSSFTGSIGTMRCSLCRLNRLGSENFWLSLDEDILSVLKTYTDLSESLKIKERQLWTNNNVDLEYKERIARLRMRNRTRVTIERQSENKIIIIIKDGHTVYCIEGKLHLLSRN